MLSLYINAQEKPTWEALQCDTAVVSKSEFNVRSIALNLLKKDTLGSLRPKHIYFGHKDEEGKIYWNIINESSNLKHAFLDSLSVQYLKTLIGSQSNLYEKWKIWLEKDRTEFLNRRSALMDDFSTNYPDLKIKVISDVRTHQSQQAIVKKGYSLANLSFHEWGLASDFGIYEKGKYLKQKENYLYLREFCEKYQLRWGGNFVGFVDYPHIQMYYNGAELLRKHPYLAIEYERYYEKYLSRIREQIAKNKEHEVEDSKELLSEINALRKREKCYVQTSELSVLAPFEVSKNFNSNHDVLIFWDGKKSELYTILPSEGLKKHKAGVWQ